MFYFPRQISIKASLYRQKKCFTPLYEALRLRADCDKHFFFNSCSFTHLHHQCFWHQWEFIRISNSLFWFSCFSHLQHFTSDTRHVHSDLLDIVKKWNAAQRMSHSVSAMGVSSQSQCLFTHINTESMRSVFTVFEPRLKTKITKSGRK